MKRWFYLIVGLQLLFLVAEATSYQVRISRSPVVTLKVVPVDPRSLFMGNYMALDYDISTIDLSKVEHDPLSKSDMGETVYVTLIPDKPWARVASVTTTPPHAPPDRPYLRAQVTRISGSALSVYYGLDRYYIPESAQEKVNSLWPAFGEHLPEITAEVAVLGHGKGLIRRVLVNGKPF